MTSNKSTNEMMKLILGGYELDDDRDRLDIDAICEFLLHQAYWHRWRCRADIEEQLRNSWRCVGLYTSSGAQVGFARALSDQVVFAYLADMYVLPSHRGRGLGLALARELIDAPEAQNMRWLLHTADAHRFYEKLGFRRAPTSLMERPGPLPAISDSRQIGE